MRLRIPSSITLSLIAHTISIELIFGVSVVQSVATAQMVDDLRGDLK